jgi:hypothetical protein
MRSLPIVFPAAARTNHYSSRPRTCGRCCQVVVWPRGNKTGRCYRNYYPPNPHHWGSMRSNATEALVVRPSSQAVAVAFWSCFAFFLMCGVNVVWCECVGFCSRWSCGAPWRGCRSCPPVPPRGAVPSLVGVALRGLLSVPGCVSWLPPCGALFVGAQAAQASLVCWGVFCCVPCCVWVLGCN